MGDVSLGDQSAKTQIDDLVHHRLAQVVGGGRVELAHVPSDIIYSRFGEVVCGIDLNKFTLRHLD